MTSNKKAIWGWAMYDWANSAFATTVIAGFFPIFFKEFWSLGANANVSTARLGVANAVAGLVVALAAPVLGAVADRAGIRKRLLLLFAYLGVLMSGALFFIGSGMWEWAVFVYVMGVVGFSGANVFYDALLPTVAGNRLDRVSSLGYALGYLGGGLLFLINVLMTLMPHRFGLPDAAAAVRVSFLTVALWWGGFTLLTLRWVPGDEQLPVGRGPWRKMITDGVRQVLDMFRALCRQRTIGLFLLAYWFYIDGVDTIVRMAVDYGLSLGFDKTDLILSLLVVQFVGFPAAIAFGILGEKWGVRKGIYLGIASYLFITCWGSMISSKKEFYILAVMIGLVQGGLQALSRSYYSRLIPAERTAQYFGLYNLIGKFAAIMGPALMAVTGLAVRRLLMPTSPTPAQLDAVGILASRWSIGSLIILFTAGGLFFYFSGRKNFKCPGCD